MPHVTSADGTRIAYDRQGTGPAVILVGGTLDDGAENAPLARLLANHFTVYNYARRGRGNSGNTPPYALAREVEDLDALIATAGGSAHLYGASSGGALALEAAAAGSAIDKIAVWDVPYVIGDDQWPRFDQYLADTHEAHKAGRDEELLELFMRLTGGPDADIATYKQYPIWASSVALAHTLVKDAVILSGHRGSDHRAPVRRPPDRLLRPRRESDNRCGPPDRTTHARRAGTRRRPRTHGPCTEDVLQPVTRRLIRSRARVASERRPIGHVSVVGERRLLIRRPPVRAEPNVRSSDYVLFSRASTASVTSAPSR